MHGGTAYIWPDPHTGNWPRVITLCLGIQLPHWEPRGWVDYTHINGTYHWTGTTT